MERFSPINLFISVDLPTLGLPTMLTKPALWIEFDIWVANIIESKRFIKKASNQVPFVWD
jgi:hypothetical protein